MVNIGYLIVIAISSAIGSWLGACSIATFDKEINIEHYIKTYK